MSKRKIFIYIPSLSGGGTERFFTQLAMFLSESEKYQVTYFYSINIDKSSGSFSPFDSSINDINNEE